MKVQPETVNVIPEVQIEEVAKATIFENQQLENHDDSFYICDLGDVVNKHRLWLDSFKRIKPFYAIKCNPNDVVLKTLIKLGTGFDCASKIEIQKMLTLGARPDDIIFANPCKQSSHIKFARNSAVTTMVFDSEDELYKIKRLFPQARLVLRMQTDDSAAVCRFSMKFGASILSCNNLLEKAKELKLNVVGVSFHVGSGCQDPLAYVEALRNAENVFQFARSIGFDFTLLDIGGGFFGCKQKINFFKEMAVTINKTLDQLFPADSFADLQIIAEPGRYYAASAFTLATNVIAKKDVSRDIQTYVDENSEKGAILNSVKPSACDEPAYMYFVNDGVYGSFNCLFYDHATVTPSLLYKNNGMKFSCSIWGPSCDGLDKILDCALLPELQPGEWIIWKEMGAYTISASSQFNGFKTTQIRYSISFKDFKTLQLLTRKNLPDVDFYMAKKMDI